MTISVTHSTPADSSFSSTGATAWNADHTLTGVGTVAEQDANAVAITGGSINGTTVGSTTAAAGTFTTLTATGQASLGGAAGSESLRVVTPSSAPNAYVKVFGSPFGFGYVTTDGSAAASGLLLSSKGGAQVSIYTNNFSQEQFRATHTASAVNYVQVTGAATGNAPALSAQGSDTSMNFTIAAKGSGSVSLPVNRANYLTLAGTASTGGNTSISAVGSDTNINLVLQPKGTGALQAQQTDSTATGGNARGANAVDWQTSRSTAAQVASGQLSFIGGGYGNTASQYNSTIVGGFGNTVSQVASFVGSGSSNTASGAYGGIVTGVGNTSAGYMNFIGGGYINSGTSGSVVTTQSGTMNGTTAVTLSGSNANIKVGQYIVGTSIASETYVAAISGTSLTLSKVASGSSTSTLSFYTPHGVVVGGGNNQATGSYSFIGGGGDAGTAGNRNVASGDWSFVGGGSKNQSLGLYAVISGGNNHVANNSYSTIGGGLSHGVYNSYGTIAGGLANSVTGSAASVVGGYGNSASGSYSVTGAGIYSTTRSIDSLQVISANSPITLVSGVSQSGTLILGRQTTDATPTVLASNAGAASTTNQVILPNNSAYYFKGTVVAGVTGGGNTKGWTVEGVIKRGANAASTAIVGTATVVSAYADAGAATWALTATADTTNGGLAITFTGQASTTIRCVAKIETTEMTY